MNLKLDFSLETAAERTDFINKYLQDNPNLTNTELTQISNYLMWGKDSNGEFPSNIILDTMWTRRKSARSTISFEQLTTNPEDGSITEHILNPNNTEYITHQQPAFSRSRPIPPHLKSTFEELWRKIDETDLLICFYELNTGRRTKPPRDELVNRFKPEELISFQNIATQISPQRYKYLRKYLIELRTDQYILLGEDPIITSPIQTFESIPTFGADIEVRPLGLKSNNNIWQKHPNPYKPYRPHKPESRKFYFDFEDTAHLKKLLPLIEDIYNQIETLSESHNNLESLDTLRPFVQTWEWYYSQANLKPAWKLILDLRIKGVGYKQIVEQVNQIYDTNYNEDYASYLLNQKILPKIAAAASLHKETATLLRDPSNFKLCRCCGEYKIKDNRFFRKDKRNLDGLSNKCKECEKH